MALSRSYVRCSLCQGNVSISAGNLDKLKSHLQNQHDVFHHLDFQIATNFLEDFEKDEIIVKLLPRMKVVFEGAKVPGKRSREVEEGEEEANKGRTDEDVNKYDDENKDDDENKEEGKIAYEDSSDDNFEIVADENPDGPNEKQDKKTIQDHKGQSVKEESLKAEKDNVKNIQDSGKDQNGEKGGVKTSSKLGKIRQSKRKSVQSNLRKTPTPWKESVVVDTKNNNFKTAITFCPHCQKEMLKRNIRRHLRVVHGQEQSSLPEQPLLLFQCKICSAGFSSRDELCLHTSKVHTLDIEDVEAMTLNEDNQGGMFETVRDEINIEVIENRSAQGSIKDKIHSGK